METGILEKIEKLPVDKQKEVEDFVDFLISKSIVTAGSEKPKRQFGAGKDFFGELPDDFDEPLEDFKEYM